MLVYSLDYGVKGAAFHEVVEAVINFRRPGIELLAIVENVTALNLISQVRRHGSGSNHCFFCCLLSDLNAKK